MKPESIGPDPRTFSLRIIIAHKAPRPKILYFRSILAAVPRRSVTVRQCDAARPLLLPHPLTRLHLYARRMAFCLSHPEDSIKLYWAYSVKYIVKVLLPPSS